MLSGEAHDQLARGGDTRNLQAGLHRRRGADVKAQRIHAGHGGTEFIGELDFAVRGGTGLDAEFNLCRNRGVHIRVGVAEQHGAVPADVINIFMVVLIPHPGTGRAHRHHLVRPLRQTPIGRCADRHPLAGVRAGKGGIARIRCGVEIRGQGLGIVERVVHGIGWIRQ